MYMLHLKSTDPANEQTDMLVIPVCEDKELNRNPAIKDIVRRIRRLKEFVGAAGEEIILYDLPSLKTKRVKVVGLGKSTEVSVDNMRSLGGRAVGQAADKKLSTLSRAFMRKLKRTMKKKLMIVTKRNRKKMKNPKMQKRQLKKWEISEEILLIDNTLA